MRSTILSAAIKFILPLILLVSIFLLVRGHNEVGGGFVGGLVAAAGFVLVVIADGVEASLRLLRLEPKTVIGVGLLTACLSGLLSPRLSETFPDGTLEPRRRAHDWRDRDADALRRRRLPGCTGSRHPACLHAGRGIAWISFLPL